MWLAWGSLSEHGSQRGMLKVSHTKRYKCPHVSEAKRKRRDFVSAQERRNGGEKPTYEGIGGPQCIHKATTKTCSLKLPESIVTIMAVV